MAQDSKVPHGGSWKAGAGGTLSFVTSNKREREEAGETGWGEPDRTDYVSNWHVT